MDFGLEVSWLWPLLHCNSCQAQMWKRGLTANEVTKPCLHSCLSSAGTEGCAQIMQNTRRKRRREEVLNVTSVWKLSAFSLKNFSNKISSWAQEEQRRSGTIIIIVEIVFKEIHELLSASASCQFEIHTGILNVRAPGWCLEAAEQATWKGQKYITAVWDD